MGNILAGITFLALRELLRRTFEHDMPAFIAALFTQVDHMVRRQNNRRVMLDDNDRVTLTDQAVQRFQQHVDIPVMQTRGRFIEDEDRRVTLFGRQEGRQLHTLTLTARKRTAALAQLHVADADILQRLQPLHDLGAGRILAEELHGLIDRHAQDIIDRLVAITDVQDILLEPPSVTLFALQHQIRHELHLDRDRSFSLTGLASSARRIKTEMRRRQTQLMGQRLIREQLTDLVVGFQIGHRVAAARTTQRILVHKLNILHQMQTSAQVTEIAGMLRIHTAVMFLQRRVEHLAHQTTLTAAADAGHYRHRKERKTHGEVLEVILTRTLHADIIIPMPPLRRDIIREQLRSRTSLVHHLAAMTTCLRADLNHMVSRRDDIFVMLHDHDRVA